MERDGRELRVGTDGAQADELLDSGQARFLDELNAHDGVLIEKASGMELVRTDAANDRGGVDDQVRLLRREISADRRGIAKVELRLSRREDRRRLLTHQPLAEEAAQEAPTTGQEDSFVSPEPAHVTTSAGIGPRPSCSARRKSESTMRSTSWLKDVVDSHPNCLRAFSG